MFAGYVQLDDTLSGVLVAKNGSPSPTDADSLPIFRVYGPDGFMANGSGTTSVLQTGTITGATNASPIVITSVGHGLQTGTRVTISGVLGNTAANGTWTITRIDADTFSLIGSTGNGAYTSGGIWKITGAYRFTIAALGADGYDAGQTYTVLFTYATSGTIRGDTVRFTVV